ncbi:hypothetical protein M407DRAFT_122600 [Tulasnella calospora MUT 4182]|uniref:Uncharacterized protein n=1 Tax=Tulasnella calospora MUT 4182 TaxID=1051891 RepID=A0A0C3QAM2_9AGAM|nr:hypothetical protein M407DRAFT_122600 [Tulasnella calospora MUT 4182]
MNLSWAMPMLVNGSAHQAHDCVPRPPLSSTMFVAESAGAKPAAGDTRRHLDAGVRIGLVPFNGSQCTSSHHQALSERLCLHEFILRI